MSCNLRRHSDQRFCCGGCGRAFSSTAAFDWHRRGQSCTDPAMALTAGMVGEPRFTLRKLRGVIGDVAVWGVGGENPWKAVTGVPEPTWDAARHEALHAAIEDNREGGTQ